MSIEDQGTEPTLSDEELELALLPDSVDDPMVLKAQLDKEQNARRQLTARAKKAEEELKALKEQGIRAEKPITQTPSKPYEINDEVVDLRLDGYSKQEVEWIMKNGGRKELEDQNSYTSIAINARREQLKAEQAAAMPDTVGLSEIERKYSPEQLAKMSVKELENILPHA